ncbi:QsdR family transcriptional regulator [Marinobacter bryozoorum]|uniref:QsdR family transcriptional regulator n=1 Tax=Marinobacter bryozoorum TaxID=256324 RepID=UPI0020036309|nr:QsdR family transcriptional regulator [Marinobacter bryozoorum]MCK7543519.1 QsdR family transcriptional regulator [Marinobacter bryozoorum]
MQTKITPLSRALAGENRVGSVTPIAALQIGRKRWFEGEKINMGSIAQELGVNRATLFRWVGSRDLFIGEIIWSFYQELIDSTLETSTGEGPEYVVSVCEQLLRKVIHSEALYRFIRQDPEYAIRILTSKTSLFQARSVDTIRALILEQSRKTRWSPPIDPDDLAFLVVRVGESFLYGDVISGQKTEIAQTTTAVRLLLSGHA